MRGRPILLDVIPPAATFPATSVHRAILYDDTWRTHIIIAHPEMRGNESKVAATLLGPTWIFSSTSRIGSFLFVKSGMVDEYGRLLRVVVKPMPSSHGIVPTAYFSKANGGSQVWPKN